MGRRDREGEVGTEALAPSLDPALARELAPLVASSVRARRYSYDRPLVARFQAAAGLRGDGLYGGRTRGALIAYGVPAAQAPGALYAPRTTVDYVPPAATPTDAATDAAPTSATASPPAVATTSAPSSAPSTPATLADELAALERLLPGSVVQYEAAMQARDRALAPLLRQRAAQARAAGFARIADVLERRAQELDALPAEPTRPAPAPMPRVAPSTTPLPLETSMTSTLQPLAPRPEFPLERELRPLCLAVNLLALALPSRSRFGLEYSVPPEITQWSNRLRDAGAPELLRTTRDIDGTARVGQDLQPLPSLDVQLAQITQQQARALAEWIARAPETGGDTREARGLAVARALHELVTASANQTARMIGRHPSQLSTAQWVRDWVQNVARDSRRFVESVQVGIERGSSAFGAGLAILAVIGVLYLMPRRG